MLDCNIEMLISCFFMVRGRLKECAFIRDLLLFLNLQNTLRDSFRDGLRARLDVLAPVVDDVLGYRCSFARNAALEGTQIPECG